MIPTATIDKLEQCFHALAELGAQLSDAEWETPTDLPGWSVKDNLSHLVGIERMMQGLPATEHRSGERDYIRNPIGANNENEVDARRGRTLAIRWIVNFSRDRREKHMSERLANELLDALGSQGGAFKKKDDIYRMAQANRAFAHYRW